MSSSDASDRVLLARADAGARVGLGHLMRTLALAEAWAAQGGRAVFMTDTSPAVQKIVGARGFELMASRGECGSADDLAATRAAVEQTGADWVVVDGYRFDTAYLESLADLVPLVALDDGGNSRAAGIARIVV